ncbi:MAG: ABC transporter permease subunit [Treponema sp.]|nr:ABC transporter permease subunit [Treponema sp.]
MDNKTAGTGNLKVKLIKKESQLWKDILRHRSVYILLLLPVAYFIIFRYLPIWNAQIAFKNFLPRRGVIGSDWIGFTHFTKFFESFYFWGLIRNTLFYSFGKLLVSVPAAILLAVTIYECTRPKLARVVQTLAYLPHFLSWVIMLGILQSVLAPDGGIVNEVIKVIGGEPVDFLANQKSFPWIVILSDAWKEMGWSAIIFIAALIGIDPQLYEAAMVEGVNAPQRVWYITLPSIRPVIVMVVLLRLGTILDAGFNQIYILYSEGVYEVADIIDTYVFREALMRRQWGFGTAIGLFKGAIGFILILTSNWMVRRVSDNSLF